MAPLVEALCRVDRPASILAPRTGCAPVEVGFGSAVWTGKVAGNSCARQTDRLPNCVRGKAGENAVVAALGADTASVHR
jgi:hypothetical protein